MNDTVSAPLPAISVPSADPEPAAPWGWLRRLGFRFSFSYFVVFALLHGNVTLFIVLPWIGRPIQGGLSFLGRTLAQGIADDFFHLTGVGARWHAGGSGDKALDYILVLCFVAIAMGATVIWSAVDR